jgi:CspA family cold shock protein
MDALVAVPTDETLQRVEGAIKWYDVAKGYGFVAPDTPGMGDALLHRTVLSKGGFKVALEGARVVCLVRKEESRWRVSEVIAIDLSTAIPSRYPESVRAVVQDESGLERAIVKWFNSAKGFGFLTRGEGTEDIFIHMETLRRHGLTDLGRGLAVLCRFGSSDKGLTATEIHPDTGTIPSRPALD